MQNQNLHKTTTLLKTDLSKRIYGLDILRAIAILCVLIGHGLEFLPVWTRSYLYHLTAHGVTMFFVLSGFLIGRILIKTFEKPDFSHKSLLKFWMNRWIRTIPPYYLALTVLLLVIYGFDMIYKPHLTTNQIIRFYLFLQNFQYEALPFFVESWSLPVEEWFYFISPIILFFLYKVLKLNLNKSIIIMILTITISVLMLRIYRYCNDIPYIHQVVTRMDSLMFGVLGAFCLVYKNKLWEKYKKATFITACFLLSITFIIDIYFADMPYYELLFGVIGLTLYPALFFLMLGYLNSIKKGSGICYILLTYISLISYSLYLFHHTLTKYIIVHTFSVNMYVDGILYWGISFIIATIVYLYFEKPCMDVRKKIKFLQK